jgi:hypothetical protein
VTTKVVSSLKLVVDGAGLADSRGFSPILTVSCVPNAGGIDRFQASGLPSNNPVFSSLSHAQAGVTEDTMDTVLIVEDSRPMQRTLQRLFESDGL